MSPWPGMAPQARPQLSTPRRKPPHKVPSAPRGEKAHTFPPSYYYEARGRANAPQYRAHHFPHRTTRPHQQKRADKAPTNSSAALGWTRAAFAERVCKKPPLGVTRSFPPLPISPWWGMTPKAEPYLAMPRKKQPHNIPSPGRPKKSAPISTLVLR